MVDLRTYQQPRCSDLASKCLTNEALRREGIQIATVEPMYKNKGGRPNRYPWSDLKLGESFMVPAYGCDRFRVRNSLSSCRNNVQKNTRKKFSLRTTTRGIRVFRVK